MFQPFTSSLSMGSNLPEGQRHREVREWARRERQSIDAGIGTEVTDPGIGARRGKRRRER